jgi:hypothetical protein
MRTEPSFRAGHCVIPNSRGELPSYVCVTSLLSCLRAAIDLPYRRSGRERASQSGDITIGSNIRAKQERAQMAQPIVVGFKNNMYRA